MIRLCIAAALSLCVLTAIVEGKAPKYSRHEIVAPYCIPHSTEADSLFKAACDQEIAGEYGLAASLYLEAIAADSMLCDAYDNLGRVYRVLGKYDSAIILYRKSLEIMPDNNVAMMNLGVALTNMGRLNEADSVYAAMIDMYADDPEGFFGKGKLLYLQERPAEALPYLNRAESLYVEQQSDWLPDAYLFIALCYSELKEFSRSKSYFERCAADFKSSGFVNYQRALVYLLQEPQDADSAVIFLRMAAELKYPLPEELQKLISDR